MLGFCVGFVIFYFNLGDKIDVFFLGCFCWDFKIKDVIIVIVFLFGCFCEFFIICWDGIYCMYIFRVDNCIFSF